MNVGVISDVHGNKVALDAVLADMPPVDALICAGDVVGYNPWPADCVDELRERGVPTVMGNHDRAVASGTTFRFNNMAAAGVEHAREELDEEQLDWLESLPDERVELEGRVKIVHGHPDDPDRYTYPREFSARMLEDEDVLVMGHTHIQHCERYGGGIVLNPGSVGQPRDGDPRAAYAVVDLDAMDVDLYRVAYDIDAVIEAVEATSLPGRIGQRLRDGE